MRQRVTKSAFFRGMRHRAFESCLPLSLIVAVFAYYSILGGRKRKYYFFFLFFFFFFFFFFLTLTENYIYSPTVVQTSECSFRSETKFNLREGLKDYASCERPKSIKASLSVLELPVTCNFTKLPHASSLDKIRGKRLAVKVENYARKCRALSRKKRCRSARTSLIDATR